MSEPTRAPVTGESIRAVRLGHGANCSSIGSVVDTLFVTSLLGGALFAAVLGALEKEPTEVIGPRPSDAEPAASSEDTSTEAEP